MKDVCVNDANQTVIDLRALGTHTHTRTHTHTHAHIHTRTPDTWVLPLQPGLDVAERGPGLVGKLVSAEARAAPIRAEVEAVEERLRQRLTGNDNRTRGKSVCVRAEMFCKSVFFI